MGFRRRPRHKRRQLDQSRRTMGFRRRAACRCSGAQRGLCRCANFWSGWMGRLGSTRAVPLRQLLERMDGKAKTQAKATGPVKKNNGVSKKGCVPLLRSSTRAVPLRQRLERMDGKAKAQAKATGPVKKNNGVSKKGCVPLIRSSTRAVPLRQLLERMDGKAWAGPPDGQGTSEGNWASQEEQWGFEEGSGKPKSELPEQGGKGREESARPKEGLAELTEPKLFVRRLPQGGYGFVSFEDLEAARRPVTVRCYGGRTETARGPGRRAVDRKSPELWVKEARTWAPSKSRLLVEGVAQTLKEELREHLECFGTVKEMTFTGDGRCEVTFGLSGSAAAACAKASIVLNGEALRLSVMEEQRTRPDEGEGDEETTKMVFLQKVPEDWTSVEARQYFQKFGQVVELTLPFEADGERGALLTFDSCESSAKAIAFAKVGAPKPYFAGAAVKAEKEPPQEVFLHVRNVAPGRRLDTSDVFKIFGKYSLARIRDLEGEAMVEFASTGECIKAFEEQDGVRANGVQLALEGSTRDAFMEFRKRQERTWGGPRPPGR
ncbi:unnamed protein product [Durusdinium trenchii]|uniref:RRM domain-containing protein n=1 Tax=Durusdinium trenchii TaxID=1381693 RepID=A0ABP0K1U6_9DINO